MFDLVVSFLGIGIGSYGGGVVTLGLIFHELVTVRGWLDAERMRDIITLAQMTPGPFAINSATYAGFTVAGLAGSAIATIAVVVPSLAILSVSLLIRRHLESRPDLPLAKLMPRLSASLRPGILALLGNACVSFGVSALTGVFQVAVFAVSLLVFWRLPKLHPLLVFFAAGLVGVAVL